MTTDERLASLEKQLTRRRRLSRCLLPALCLSLAAWALVGTLQPNTAVAYSPGDGFDPALDARYRSPRGGGTSGLVVIVIIGAFLGVGAILVWIDKERRQKPPKCTIPARPEHKPQEAGARICCKPTMKATVDAELCTGCGLCVDTCPAVFSMGYDDIAVVRTDDAAFRINPVDDPEHADAWWLLCCQAAEDCPIEAIAIEAIAIEE